MNRDNYRYTYENEDDFSSFPTIAVLARFHSPNTNKGLQIPGLNKIEPQMVIHGEESVTFDRPIRPDTRYMVEARLADIQDKGKGMLLVME